jgi:hypothetical protein
LVAVAADNPPKLNPLPLGAFFLFDVDDEDDEVSSPPPPPLRLNNPPPNAGAGGVVAAAGADGPPKLNPVEALGAVVVDVEGLAEAGAAPPKLNPTLGAASLPVDDDEKENPEGGLVVAGAPKLKAMVRQWFVVVVYEFSSRFVMMLLRTRVKHPVVDHLLGPRPK